MIKPSQSEPEAQTQNFVETAEKVRFVLFLSFNRSCEDVKRKAEL